jgi:hypothetical protein
MYQGLFAGVGMFDQHTGQWRMTWADNGNIGINGVVSPAQALEVNGKVQVDSLASATSTALCINGSGVLSSCSSSVRYKEDIRDAGFGIKEIEAMRPVTFKWKGRNENDFGLIAEEVAKINPEFVTYKDDKIEGVKYPQLTAVLINAAKALKTANDGQAAEIARLRRENAVILGRLQQQADVDQEMRNRIGALEHKVMFRTADNLTAAKP